MDELSTPSDHIPSGKCLGYINYLIWLTKKSKLNGSDNLFYRIFN